MAAFLQKPGPEAPFQRALFEERQRVVRWLNAFRVSSGALWLTLALIATGMGEKIWRQQLPLLGTYVSVALVLFLWAQRSSALQWFSVYAVAGVDIPFAFLVQLQRFQRSSEPLSVVAFTVALFVLLISSAVLSLNVRAIVAAAMVAVPLG